MKYNKSNIITDRDIDLTYSDRSKTLGETLAYQQEQIDQLKSNVKWMYKYGALGSGAGGGGGSSTSSYKVLIYKGNELVKSGSTLYYSSAGTYPITVQILNGGTSTYRVQFSYENGGNTPYVDISAADSFSTTQMLQLNSNSTLNITVIDQNTRLPYEENGSSILSFPYIVEAYRFSAYYVFGNNPNTTDTLPQYTPVSNSIFMSQMRSTGIMLALHSNIAININEDATKLYYDTFDGKRINLIGTQTKITKGEKTIYLPLADDIIEYLSDNTNASYKHIELGLSITLEGNINPEPIFIASFRDNLIPNGLYLKVNTSGGTMLKREGTIEEMYNTVENISLESRFNPGDIIFNITPYCNEQNKNRIYYGNVDVYDVENGEVNPTPSYSGSRIQLTDQETSNIIAQCPFGGIKKLVFTLELNSDELSDTAIYEYWINVNVLESNFNWYPDSTTMIPISSSYYRNGLETSHINIDKNNLIEYNINTNIRSLTFDNIHEVQQIPLKNINGIIDVSDIMMNIGIQYLKNNDTTQPILSFNVDGSTDTQIGADSIFVYQDRIVVTSGISTIRDNTVSVGTTREECEIFIPLCDMIDKTNKSNYHLLSLYKRLENFEGNNYWKALYAFIDGCVDGVISNFLSINKLYSSITFYPGNYIVNLVDISYWEHNPNSVLTNRTYLEDNDIAGFWYTYNLRMKSLLGINTYTDDDIYLYNSFSTDFYEDESNNIYYKSDAVPSNIAQHIDVPVVVLYYDDVNGNVGGVNVGRNKDNLKEFLDGRYQPEDDGLPKHIPVTVQYSQGKSQLEQIKLPNSSESAIFKISIQGTSTRTYKCKNLELEAPDHPHPDDFVYIYSPNNNPDPNDVDAFLPEQSFTLKADVVDSSHTNNNAMGAFIDANTRQFSDAAEGQNTRYISRLKNCLTGYPCLVFLHTKYYTDDSRIESKENRFFLGIYNFNLGRHSAFNMGYKNISVLDNMLETSERGFKIFELSINDNMYLDNIEVAEIQDNNKHFDFSQYDPSVLFKLPTMTNDKTFMWEDFISNTNHISLDQLKTNIATFVEKIAHSGGYLFKRIQKIFSNSPDNNYGYDQQYSATDDNGEPLMQVPNFRYQYRRYLSPGGQLLSEYVDKGEVTDAQLLINIMNTLFNYQTLDGDENTAAIDFRSLTEYYTICMAFGLVDSPMKNLNIKSWNSGTSKRWYLAFYDMDTGLGKTNAGTKMSYFAFSDYWRSKYTTDKDGKITLQPVEIFRDWSPFKPEGSQTFFDVPSTYLFAIAKYAYQVLRLDLAGTRDISVELQNMQDDDPSNIWGTWRKLGGCLESAQSFMNNYFTHHLKNIPEVIFNLNYRYKYFIKDNVNSPKAYNGEDFAKFHGRNIAYITDWLDGRFHILDAYFNVSNYPDMITNEISAPYITDAQYKPSDNPDVYILREIFSADNLVGNRYPQDRQGDVQLTARPLSPIHINVSNAHIRYLFPENISHAYIHIPITGMQTVLFGGSNLWTDLSTINNFIGSGDSLTIQSKYLENIIGNDKTCTQWNINSTALKKLSLTYPGYSGSLIIEPRSDNQFTNITEIDISNTRINLRVNNVPVKIIRATNKPGGDLILSNLNYIDELYIDGKFNTLSLNAWKQHCMIPTSQSASLDCPAISITNNKDRFPDNSIIIQNNPSLTDVNIVGFNYVTIKNCPKLENIKISQANLKSFILNMPNSKNPETIMTFNNGEPGVFDLSSYNELSEISISNANITDIILGDNLNIELPDNAFTQCRMLEHINVGEGTKLYLTGPSTFQNCNNLIYDNIPIHVKMGTTNLAYTFSCLGIEKGKMTFENVKKFFDDIKDDIQDVTLGNGNVVKRPPTMYVTSIKDMFRNQSIVYTKERGIEEYNNHTCSITLSLFLRCFGLEEALANNEISFLNRYMLCETNENGEIYRLGHTLTNSEGYYVRKIMNINNLNNIFTTIDLLDDVIQDCSGLQCQNTTLQFVDSTGIPMNQIKINDFFTASNTKMNYITNISNFTISNVAVTESGNYSIIFDFSELFNSPKYDNATHNIIPEEYGDKWNKYDEGIQLFKFMDGSYTIDSWNNINYLLSNCRLSGDTYSSFGSFVAKNINVGEYNALNIGTFINWNKLNLLTSLFHSTTLYSGQTHGISDGLNVQKYVTYNDLHTIIEAILNTENLKYVGALFNNCTVIMDNTSEEFTLVGKDEFGKLKQFENTTLKSISGLFTNMKISMFGINGNDPIIITHDFMKPFRNVISYVRTFENWYLKYPLPFDFFNKRKEIIEILPGYKGTIDGQGTNVTKYTYEYTNNIIDINHCFKNVKFASCNAFKISGIYDESGINVNADEDGNLPRRNRFTYELDNNIVISNKVYFNNIEVTLDPSYEIIDAENAEQEGYSLENYTGENIMIGSSSGYLRNIPKEYIDPSGCFITPDILYGIASNGYFQDAFTRDVDYKDTSYRTFTGTIPPHMMSKLMNKKFTEMFDGLNITPIHLPEYDENGNGIDKYYVFVPNNFSNYSDFSNSFRFNMIFPSHNSEYREFFALLTDKSLPNMTRLSDSTMTFRYDGSDDMMDGSATMANVHLEDSGLRWNIMISLDNNEIKYGINANLFQYMRYDYILNSWQAFMYYGHVILNDDAGWNISKLYNNSSVLYSISAIDNQFPNILHISKNIRFNAKYDNDHYFGINTGIQTYVNKESLVNCSNIDPWIENYPTAFHIVQ